MDVFSTREIAVGLWTCAFVAWALSIRGMRESIWALLKQAFLSKLILVWLSMAAYAAHLVIALRELGLWTTERQKETLIWFAFSALAYPFQFHDPQKTPHVLRVLARDSLSVLILIEVLVNTYTFSLPVELVLVPTITIIAIMGAVTEAREEHKPVAKLLGRLQALLGLFLVSLVVLRAFQDPDYRFLQTLASSLIVVILSLASWPYIHGLRVAFAHEGMLWRIGRNKEVSRLFAHYAAFRILRHLRFRPMAVAPFVRRNAFQLFNVEDRTSLEMLLNEDRQSWDEPVGSESAA